MEKTLSYIRPLIPSGIFRFFQSPYHWLMSFIGALIYGFPSRKIKVIGVTGTKGKSSTVEILSAILEEAGYRTALSNTIRFKIGRQSEDNLHKMSMPGRFFMQRFLRQAVRAGCDYAVLEMTSQGVIFHRHRFIDLDLLVFTNLSPEHIESHGSYERYVEAKVALAEALMRSHKPYTIMIVNGDDAEAHRFLSFDVDRKVIFGLQEAQSYEIKEGGIDFSFEGKRIHSPLKGEFNLYNILAAANAARSQNVSDERIVSAIENFRGVRGRVEKIEAGQDFTVIVDYAHTPDSLEKLYQAFGSTRKICVLGGTGGGRDTWKRPAMGGIADKYCSEIILTDEDPYDEDPRKIVEEVATGVRTKQPKIIMDRREAIREALKLAKKDDVVLITGKGTDPYIMGPKDSKVPWSDAQVAREELARL